jgi:hypothetical protein
MSETVVHDSELSLISVQDSDTSDCVSHFFLATTISDDCPFSSAEQFVLLVAFAENELNEEKNDSVTTTFLAIASNTEALSIDAPDVNNLPTETAILDVDSIAEDAAADLIALAAIEEEYSIAASASLTITPRLLSGKADIA